MATKVSIVEVDLREDIKTIITDEIQQLTARTADQIAVFQAAQQATQAVRQARISKREAVEQKLLAAYDRILLGAEVGVPVAEIIASVHPEITTTSGFALRLKTWLKARGNQYIVQRKKVNRVDHYVLVPWNRDDESTSP